jgi:hypothetical protein
MHLDCLPSQITRRWLNDNPKSVIILLPDPDKYLYICLKLHVISISDSECNVISDFLVGVPTVRSFVPPRLMSVQFRHHPAPALCSMLLSRPDPTPKRQDSKKLLARACVE